jgi:hydrogenase maturation factor HypF (carbamoyltransferase family)
MIKSNKVSKLITDIEFKYTCLDDEIMRFFHNKKNDCIQCDAKFDNHDDLVKHVRHEHHKTIVICQQCKREFIHEKDRLHHAREEHKHKLEERSRKDSHPEEYKTQSRVDAFRSRFSDKL